jgi:hypothetical protein
MKAHNCIQKQRFDFSPPLSPCHFWFTCLRFTKSQRISQIPEGCHHICSAYILPNNVPWWVGRAIAQAVSRWLPTAAARVRARVWQVGSVVDKVALRQVFSEYFGFPCQSLFHQLLHNHNHSGQVQEGSSGRRAEWTQYGLHPHYAN